MLKGPPENVEKGAPDGHLYEGSYSLKKVGLFNVIKFKNFR